MKAETKTISTENPKLYLTKDMRKHLKFSNNWMRGDKLRIIYNNDNTITLERVANERN